MAEPINYAGDFRDEADGVSRELLKRKRLADTSDLTKAGKSVCIRRPPEAVGNRRYLSIVFGVQIGLSLALIFGGGALVFYTTRITHDHYLFIVGTVISLVGLLAASSAVDVQNWIIRRHLAGFQGPEQSFLSTEKPVVVHIEDSQNCHEMKLVVEDLGLMYSDAARKLIVIEGVFYRYVIWGLDVQECRLYQPKTTRHFIMTFQLADPGRTLSLAMSYNNIGAEFMRQITRTAARAPLAGMSRRTLAKVPIA